MTPTLTAPMPHSNRICRQKTGSPLTIAEERELRTRLLATVAALDARPEPKDIWDALGRHDADVRHPRWLSMLPELFRSALEAAKADGDRTLQQTVQLIDVFYDELYAFTVRGYELARSEDLDRELVRLTEESTEVTVAAARALQEPSERNLEAVRTEILEAEAQGEKMIDLASRRIAHDRSRNSRQLAIR